MKVAIAEVGPLAQPLPEINLGAVGSQCIHDEPKCNAFGEL
jgi:hypothetical protein